MNQMFGAILRREIYMRLSGFTGRFSFLVLTVLVPLSAYTQTLYFKQFVADFSVRQNLHESENTYRSATVAHAVPPMLPLFNGVYYDLPNEIILRGGSNVNIPASDDLEPLDQFFPKADLSLLVGVLMTLIAVLLGYDTVSGEREHGTLRLMLSFPVRRRTILAAKLLGVTAVMSLSLIYSMTLYVIIVEAYGGGTFQLNGARLGQLAVVFLISLLSLVIFVALGVAASILAKNSAVALTGSAIAWVILLFVWPSTAPYAVSAMWSVPPNQYAQHQRFVRESELIYAEMADHRALAAELKSQNVGREAAWQRYQDMNRYWINKKRDELRQLTEERKRQVRKQQSAAMYLSLLSPYGAFFHAMANICGTSLNDYYSFVDSVAAYEENEFAPASIEAMAEQKPWVADASKVEMLKVRDFQMAEPRLTKRLMAASPAVVSLLVQMLVLIAVCFVRFSSYDSR